MPETKARLLIVDDEPSIRDSMSQLLIEVGYQVRCAGDGFSALAEIRREVPEILISDLNMPGMAGIELLSVVRRRFPRIRLVAMSGTLSRGEAAPGVAADAFYPKGGSVVYLLGILESLTPHYRNPPQPATPPPPIWIARNGHNTSGEAFATIECPECLRAFPRVLNGAIGPVSETACIHCGSLVRFAIVRPEDQVSSLPHQHKHSAATPAFRPPRRLRRKMSR
jgi:CheY-like chemotaxis protein